MTLFIPKLGGYLLNEVDLKNMKKSIKRNSVYCQSIAESAYLLFARERLQHSTLVIIHQKRFLMLYTAVLQLRII